MASIINELVDVLNEEKDFYQSLTEIAKEKTPVIIKGNIDELQKITEKEQPIVENLQVLEKKRAQIMDDAADVLGKEQGSL